jgi:hypothetical protein
MAGAEPEDPAAGFTPAGPDDPGVQDALEHLREDGTVYGRRERLAVRKIWTREDGTDLVVRMQVHLEAYADPGQRTSRLQRFEIWVDVIRDAHGNWRSGERTARAAVTRTVPGGADLPAGSSPCRLMFTCPERGVAVPTGIVMPAEDFLFAELTGNSLAPCPSCGSVHPWDKEDVHLEPVPARSS